MKRQLEEAQQLKAGEVEKVIENRVKGLKADWDKQVAALTSERETLTNSPLLQPSTSTSSVAHLRKNDGQIGDRRRVTDDAHEQYLPALPSAHIGAECPARRVPLLRCNGPAPPAVRPGQTRASPARNSGRPVRFACGAPALPARVGERLLIEFKRDAHADTIALFNDMRNYLRDYHLTSGIIAWDPPFILKKAVEKGSVLDNSTWEPVSYTHLTLPTIYSV